MVEYKGVNLAGMEFGNASSNRVNVDYVVPGKSEYDYWGQSVGSNVIRLPFTWERLQPQANGELNQEYLGYLKSSVSWAKQNGMSIALDLHNYARYNGQVVGADQLTNVWKKLAAEFGGDDSVWFNLMNEPYNVSATQWANTTQQTVNNLRAAGIDNKLLLSGTAWSGAHSWVSSGNAAAYDGFKDPLNNFAFDVHQYLDGDSSGTSGTAISGAGSTRLVKVTEWAEAKGFKLFLGEAGVAENAASHKEMGDMMQYMENHSEAWLGWSLWGAGPWWGNYYFEINPQGTTHDPSISALMKYMTPNPSTEPTPDPDPVPNPDPDPTPDPDPQPEPVPGTSTAELNHGADNIQGTSGNDVVSAWHAQIEASDVVKLGDGFDTLQIRNTGLPLFDTTGLTGFSGVDHIDITASDGWTRVVLTEAFIAQSDNDSITVSYGSAGIGRVDVATDTPNNYSFAYGDKKITVTYKGGSTTPDPDPTPDPTPDPDPQPEPVQGVTVELKSKADTVTGTAGDDTLLAWATQFNPTDTLKMGAGLDTLKMLSGTFTFDSKLYTKVSGLDHIELTRGGKYAKVLLDQAFLESTDNGEFKISFGSQKLGTLDTSALDAGEFDVVWASDSVTVKLKDGQPDPNPEPDPVEIAKPAPTPYTDVAGITASIKSGATTINGTNGNDTAKAYNGQLDATDVVKLNGGYDTLKILSSRPVLDTDNFKAIQGVDHLDLTAATRTGEVTLRPTFLANSDNGELTISFGQKGLKLDTGSLDHNATDVFLYGSGDVLLGSGNDEATFIKGARANVDGGGGDDAIYGDTANDQLFGGAGRDLLYGHDGDDLLQGDAGADLLIGGAGADTFRYTDIGDAGDIIQGFGSGDKLDLTELLASNGMDSVEGAIANGKVTVTQNGANAQVAFQGTTLVTLENINTDDLQFTSTATI